MKYFDHIIYFVIIVLLLVYGCNEPGDPSSYGNSDSENNDSVNSRVTVSINLDNKVDRQNSEYNVNHTSDSLEGLPSSTKTALIIAVLSGTSFNVNQDLITSYEDKALINLATSIVTLNLPLDESILLYEYTFNAAYSSSSSLTGKKAYSTAKMGPITITSSTTQVSIQATLYKTLAGAFSDVISNGTYSIEIHDNSGDAEYSYSSINWTPAPLTGSDYTYDPTTDIWSSFVPTDNNIEFFDNTHDVGDALLNQITHDSIDSDNLKINFSDNTSPYYPDFSMQLADIIDLYDDPNPIYIESRGDMKDKDLDVPFSKGALAYEFLASGMAKYSLEEIATTHDCSGDDEINTSLNTFTELLTYYNDASSDFACKEDDHDTCLTFKNYTPGDTTGIITEVLRNPSTHQVDSSTDVGTWEIDATTDAEQPIPMLFYYPNSSDYYHDGEWTQMWAEFDDGGGSKLWEGYYSINSNPTHKMIEFNDIALNDFKDFLDSLAPNDPAFITESHGDKCYQPFDLMSTTPSDGDTGVSSSSPIYIDFSKALDTGSVTLSSASCTGGDIAIAVVNDSGFSACYTDSATEISMTFENGNTRVTINPDSSLSSSWPSGSIYFKIFSTIKSYNGDELGYDSPNISFTTP